MQQQLINGKWCAAINGNTWQVINPATEKVIATVPYGNEKDAQLAIDAAAKAFIIWKTTTPYQRAEILKKTADVIRTNVLRFAEEMVEESGKPFVEAKGEWLVAANLFEWYAEEGKRSYGKIIPTNRTDKRSQVIYQPIGVVGVITAWNFPAYNPARAWAAALAAGCTIVAKGSEYTPLSTFNLAWALHEAGVPAGVANIVNGEAEPIGHLLLKDERVRKISFTGSTRVGKFLMDGASQTNTKLSLELGGNAPVIINDDVDIEAIAKSAVTAKFRNCGQVCISPQRFYVHRKIIKKFIENALQAIKNIKVGNNTGNSETCLGPLINRRQQENVLDIIAQAKKEKAKIWIGGDALKTGYFINPCLIECKNNNYTFLQREIFGPILPIIPFDTPEEVITYANDTPYGLAAYVWTNRIKDAFYFSEHLEFGIVGINEWAAHGTELPFGGWKQSGLGHESGSEGLLEYMEKKLISFGL